MAVPFFIEPWQVEESPEALTLREEVSVRDHLLGGAVALGLSTVVATLGFWLWRHRTIGGAIAAWLGFTSAILAAKGFEQFARSWRLRIHGPRLLKFRRDEDVVELEGFRGLTSGRVERLVIDVKSRPRERVTAYDFESQKEYTVRLFINGRRIDLGTYGAEAAASRLAEAISGCIGVPLSHRSESA